MAQVPPVVARTLDKSKLQRRELESNYSFPNPYNGGVAIMREHSQTRPQYNQATLSGEELDIQGSMDDFYVSVHDN